MSQQNPLLQEIEEDLERQKIEALWKRYGSLVIAGAIVIVLATAGYTFWQSRRAQQEQLATDTLINILRTPNEADNTKTIAALETFAKESHAKTQTTFAELHAAGLAVKAGDIKQALAIYDTIANDRNADTSFRQLADLLAVQAQLDDGDPAMLEKRLQPLFVETSPWHYSALEAAAFLALRTGDKAKAKQLFTLLSQDERAPPSLAQRATDMARYLSE